MSNLHRGMKSPAVGAMQEQLNRCAPTRLPLLVVDNDFGVLTKARVMEFQFNQKLSVDGIAGTTETLPRLATVAAKATTVIKPSGRSILVNLVHNKLIAFENGKTVMTIQPIRGGSAGDPSTQGVFPMTSRRLRHHTSSEFPEPPDNMQFAMFYNRGQAIHMGPPTEPSHGCIHVGHPSIETLFNFVGKSDELVIVVKL
jgi:L,D-transpeptidase catalytic domain/Putative peptidoglycan binding domain